MSRKFICPFVPMLLMSLLTACGTVKEDRLQCPLFVFFNPDVNFFGCRTSATVRIIRDGSVSVAGVFPIGDFTAPFFSVRTQRGENTCSVVCGGTVMGNNVIFRSGEPAGEAYALCETFFGESEDEEHTVGDTLCRQTAPAELILRNDAGGGYPFALRIRSCWVGFDLISLEPVSGDYSLDIAACYDGESCSAAVCIPRQGDDTLMLDFLSGGAVVCEYPLGEAVVRSGYDWNACSLAPLSIEINCSFSRAVIAVNDWREQITINYTI